MSHDLSFHDFTIHYLGEVCASLGLFMSIIYLSHTRKQVVEDVVEDVIEDDVEDVIEDDVEEDSSDDEMTFSERLDHAEEILSKQLAVLRQLTRIEQMTTEIEIEKAKGNVLERLIAIEQKKLVYKFNITDFNKFCRSVYADVESNSRIKKRSYVIKKVGKMWREMEDEEKAVYSL